MGKKTLTIRDIIVMHKVMHILCILVDNYYTQTQENNLKLVRYYQLNQ